MMPSGWHEKTLGEFADIQRGAGSQYIKYTEDSKLGIRLIRISDFLGDKPKFVERNKDVERFILNQNDILIAGTGATAGITFGIPDNFVGYAYSYNAPRIRVNSDVDRNYTLHFLKSSHILGQQKKLFTGNAQPFLDIAAIEGFRILLPPKNEQEKIAKILSTWDEAIERIQKAIDAKVLEKEQIIRMLCISEERLSKHDSKRTIIGEFCSEFNERNKMDIHKEVLSCTKSGGFVRSLDFFDKQVYSNDLTTYKVIKRGMFGFPSNHIEEGSIGLQNVVDVGLVSPIYTIFQCDKNIIDSDFLFAILKTETYRQKFQSSTNASVDRRGSLRWNAFSKIEINLPPLEYQIRVANLIKVLNNAIELYTDIKVKTLRQKRGLMQQLLTGRKRVKV